ncbi:MAG: aromatic amino acid transport family protein [Desulfobulbus sp.]
MNWQIVLTTACMITGNLIGAGILGLPINTGLAGLIPSLVAMLAGGGMMYFSALVLGDQVFLNKEQSTFDFPSLYQKYFGNIGKWIAIVANVIILYGLLTAYFTGGAKVLGSLVGTGEGNMPLFFLFAGVLIVITCINLQFIQKLNIFFILFLAAAFAVLAVIGGSHIVPARLGYYDWSFLPATLPIIVTAFHFHNIIPVLVEELRYDLPTFRRSVMLGMLLAFIMNMVWIMVGIGVLPLSGENSILQAYQSNIPATVPMGKQLHSMTFTLTASLFAIIAICTSFLANGVGLMNFIRDLLKSSRLPTWRIFIMALAFAPPLCTATFYPDIFLNALNVVGGIGIITLFGILPASIVFMNRSAAKWRRIIAAVVLLFALAVLVVEVLQETGLLQLQPQVEYYQVDFE